MDLFFYFISTSFYNAREKYFLDDDFFAPLFFAVLQECRFSLDFFEAVADAFQKK